MSCDARFLNVPRNWAVRFLPYSDTGPLVGYPNPNKGYGYGKWVEFYENEADARARFTALIDLGAVECIELRKADKELPLLGALVDEWDDGMRDH